MMTILDTLLHVLLKIFLPLRPLANLKPRDTPFAGNVGSSIKPQDHVRLKTRDTPFAGNVLLTPQASWWYSR